LPPAAGRAAGAVRPGWSSSDGGNDELPEFRHAARSSLARRSSSSPTRSAHSVLRRQHRDELALQRDQRITGNIQRAWRSQTTIIRSSGPYQATRWAAIKNQSSNAETRL